MSIDLLVMGAFYIYGLAAFPEGYIFPNDHDLVATGHGSITTCTVQGFFIQFSFLSAIFYYSFFSVYSFLGVPNNFRFSTFDWKEKYIHVAVHLFPLAATSVQLSSDSYNPTPAGYCSWSERSPWSCEGLVDVPCERGSPETTYYLVTIVIGFFILIATTSIMWVLYCRVKRNQANIRISTRSVAIQSFVYLLSLYWVISPFIVNEILMWVNSSRTHDTHTSLKGISILAVLNPQCLGFFSLLVYRYFSSGTYHRTIVIVGDGGKRSGAVSRGGGCGGEEEATIGNGGSSSFGMTTNPSEKDYSFNIFDGTNVSGAFAAFVRDGDEGDASVDAHETEQWSGMQGL